MFSRSRRIGRAAAGASGSAASPHTPSPIGAGIPLGRRQRDHPPGTDHPISWSRTGPGGEYRFPGCPALHPSRCCIYRRCQCVGIRLPRRQGSPVRPLDRLEAMCRSRSEECVAIIKRDHRCAHNSDCNLSRAGLILVFLTEPTQLTIRSRTQYRQLLSAHDFRRACRCKSRCCIVSNLIR